MNFLAETETIACGDITIIFATCPEGRRVEMRMVPTQCVAVMPESRDSLRNEREIRGLPENWGDFPARSMDSMVQFHCATDACGPGFAGGVTMRNSPSLESLCFEDREVEEDDTGICIRSQFRSAHGLVFQHEIFWQRDCPVLRVELTCRNEGTEVLPLEMLGTFSLGGITPFDPADACGRLKLHRFRSAWSAEGRPCSDTIEALHLERSWTGHAHFSHRFGQVGSMPVREYFPFAAVEDTVSKVTWAAQLACPGSWQMELSRRGDDLCLSGGLADYEFGHWRRELHPGESLTTPAALLTVVAGGRDEACRRLRSWARSQWQPHVAEEEDMGIAYNNWCTDWGAPTHDKLLASARRLVGTPVRYFVIDDGWARRPEGEVSQSNGDWIVDGQKFPSGLKATSQAIRELGFVPGLWFEMETCSDGTTAFAETNHMLRRHGRVLNVGNRRFWDFRDTWVHDYLHQRVTGLLRECDFGYLKVDYNDTIGLGCDTTQGDLGEGLREHLVGVQRFWCKLREELPELVVENCASGGHRLEPSMLALSDLSSFSDAHETVEIPLIAGQLLSLVLARQLQMWAVLRVDDDLERIRYSMAATFLGRMVLSGDIEALNETQWREVKDAMAFYRDARFIIRDGEPTRYGNEQVSFRHPTGWQAVVFDHADHVLVVIHTCANPLPDVMRIPLPDGQWETEAVYGLDDHLFRVNADLEFINVHPFCGGAIRLRRVKT